MQNLYSLKFIACVRCLEYVNFYLRYYTYFDELIPLFIHSKIWYSTGQFKTITFRNLIFVLQIFWRRYNAKIYTNRRKEGKDMCPESRSRNTEHKCESNWKISDRMQINRRCMQLPKTFNKSWGISLRCLFTCRQQIFPTDAALCKYVFVFGIADRACLKIYCVWTDIVMAPKSYSE